MHGFRCGFKISAAFTFQTDDLSTYPVQSNIYNGACMEAKTEDGSAFFDSFIVQINQEERVVLTARDSGGYYGPSGKVAQNKIIQFSAESIVVAGSCNLRSCRLVGIGK
jgi:hypothetical protein